MNLDKIDRRILEVLQANNLIGMDRLGELVGLSTSAAQRRVRRLRDEGVITADISIVDPDAIGRHMTFVVEVTLERENAEVFEAFKRRAREAQEVQQCYYVTGDGDFVLIITAADMAEYEAISARLFMDDANIRRYRTSVVMSRIKVSLALPVPDPADKTIQG
jgi:Lrp/AsnC family transcriptional regulator, leucine-responsive regulatory protein